MLLCWQASEGMRLMLAALLASRHLSSKATHLQHAVTQSVRKWHSLQRSKICDVTLHHEHRRQHFCTKNALAKAALGTKACTVYSVLCLVAKRCCMLSAGASKRAAEDDDDSDDWEDEDDENGSLSGFNLGFGELLSTDSNPSALDRLCLIFSETGLAVVQVNIHMCCWSLSPYLFRIVACSGWM